MKEDMSECAFCDATDDGLDYYCEGQNRVENYRLHKRGISICEKCMTPEWRSIIDCKHDWFHFHGDHEPGAGDTQVCTKCSLLVTETTETPDAKARELAADYPRKFICNRGICPVHHPEEPDAILLPLQYTSDGIVYGEIKGFLKGYEDKYLTHFSRDTNTGVMHFSVFPIKHADWVVPPPISSK